MSGRRRYPARWELNAEARLGARGNRGIGANSGSPAGMGTSCPSPTANLAGAAGRGSILPKARISSHRIHYHVSNGCAVVRPEGACNADTTEALARLVNSPLIRSKHLILDLSRARYVETPGYRWIIRQLKQLESAGKSLVVVGLPPSVMRAFTLLRLDKSVPTAASVAEALERIRAPRELAGVGN